MFFGRRKNDGLASVAKRRPEVAEAERLATEGDLFEAIARLERANAASRHPEIERRIRGLRNLAGVELLYNPVKGPEYPEPMPASELPPPGEQSRVPEVSSGELTPEMLRGAILETGCLLVRGMVDSDRATRVAAGIDRAFHIRDSLDEGKSDPDGFYDELEPEPPFKITERPWIAGAGGVLAVDSPRLMYEMIDIFQKAGLPSLIEGYLGERPALSAQKCTLRKAEPTVGGAWHQDGKFLGDVRSLNVWLSLSRCGDIAPSMDIVPKRIDHHVDAGGEGTSLDIQVTDELAHQVAGEAGIVRPIFEPGDALLFDDLFLHQTGSDPSMPNPRYAIESWFFGPSAYPHGYVPIAF
jgi:hypothetical protein